MPSQISSRFDYYFRWGGISKVLSNSRERRIEDPAFIRALNAIEGGRRDLRRSFKAIQLHNDVDPNNFPNEAVLKIPIIDLSQDSQALAESLSGEESLSSAEALSKAKGLCLTQLCFLNQNDGLALPSLDELNEETRRKFIRRYMNVLNPLHMKALTDPDGAGVRFIRGIDKFLSGQESMVVNGSTIPRGGLLDYFADSFMSLASHFPEKGLRGWFSRDNDNPVYQQIFENGLNDIKGILGSRSDTSEDIDILRQLAVTLKSTVEDYLVARIKQDSLPFARLLNACESLKSHLSDK